ncbi:MAG: helix-turn-helix transcriptional regulator [Alphaproteobacteria bacterium]|nr:helix-turn-helix transcriptional regulator [Alphaproteobacteria bacterium]
MNIDNILSIKTRIKDRFRTVRRTAKMSQMTLVQRSGVSLGSIKRFERTGEISLTALIKLSQALGYEGDFDNLFVRKNYQSIFDVVRDGGEHAK